MFNPVLPSMWSKSGEPAEEMKGTYLRTNASIVEKNHRHKWTQMTVLFSPDNHDHFYCGRKVWWTLGIVRCNASGLAVY